MLPLNEYGKMSFKGGEGVDWSQIGYDSIPKYILDDFEYSKEILDNWDKNVTDLTSKFRQDEKLVNMPLVDTSKATNLFGIFSECKNLRKIPLWILVM